MHLSIVSGTYNRLSLLTQMINSARAQLPAGVLYEFVIVDGGSTDGTIEWCKQQADINLIEQGELLGAIKAFDAGAFAATGKYVILANDDVTFKPGSILPAIIHLEDFPHVGAVAFRDNRLNSKIFKVAVVPAIKPDGTSTSVPYAQVGMFRKWLGDAIGWWGLNGEFPARTYAGDNALSARIWESGYTIDDVPGCEVIDYIHDDELRKVNVANPEGGDHPDSRAYYERWPRGFQIAAEPQIDPPHKTKRELALRILYLPIYEAGNGLAQRNQRAQKRGLRDALNKYGVVYELDYLPYQWRTDDLKRELFNILDTFRPDMLLTQVHAPDVLTLETLREVRARAPRMVVVNWNGDYWPEAQTEPKMLNWLKCCDLALVVNADLLSIYEQYSIPAFYWQIGYENPPGTLPDVNSHDVLFLGQNYNNHRREFGDVLLSMRGEGVDIGIYGNYWREGEAYPDCTYDFLQGRALYKHAKLTVANNPFPDALGFVSNRIFEALAGRGALMLHQYVKGLQELTGLTPGVHYIEWKTYDELKGYIRYFLDPKNEADRRRIVEAAYRYVSEFHSFDARLRQLFTEFLPKAKSQLRKAVAISYIGRRDTPFGVKGMHTNEIYQCIPGQLLVMDTLDWEHLKANEPDIWREIGAPENDAVAEGIR